MKKSVLLVEDNESIRENTCELLELEGYEVIIATDAFKGLELVKLRLPDLILCDILMPGMDGYTFLQTIKNDLRHSTIPLIFFTAYSEPSEIKKGMSMGAVDYLVKPFDGDQLIGIVRKNMSAEIPGDDIRSSLSISKRS
jgi:CheY-like chemotaxis protein